MASPDGGLTEKQEVFAVEYVRTGNAAGAYRIAFGHEGKTDGWLYSEASNLIDHPKVAPRIEELKERAQRQSQFTVMKALEEYEEARVLAHGEAQASAAVSAVSAKVKLLGLDQPKKYKHEIGGPNGGPIETVTETPQERLQRLLDAKSA
jgi:phage terminase small subunit